jgi:hypothetical protein
LPFKDVRLIIEFTSMNEDVGVRLSHGRQIFEATAAVRLFRRGDADLLLGRAATTFRPLLLLAVLLSTSAIVAVTLRSVQALRV